MNNEINVEHVKLKTLTYLLKAIDNTNSHAGELLRNTGDSDGYDRVREFTEELRNVLLDYEEKSCEG